MTDRPTDTGLHDWLDETVGETPDPVASTRQVMSQVDETPQAGRWLPFQVFRPKATLETPTTNDTNEFQPSPAAASNGRSPNVTGRTRSMLSPVTAITTGALVFAVGGFLLIAQPFDQPASVPGAEAEAVAPTWVTGNIGLASRPCSQPESVQDGDVRRDRNTVCSPMRWSASDPRLSGSVALIINEDVHQTEDGPVAVTVFAEFVSNDTGEWACLDMGSLSLGDGEDAGDRLANPTSTCVGEGGYEGLSAILVFDEDALEFEGLIFSGDFPPAPERPADE